MSTPENKPGEPGNGQHREPEQPRYGQNPPQYGQQPSYGQNPPYGQPQPPQYGQNPPQYGQNLPQYGQNLPQYGQPQPQYGYQQPLPGQYGYPGGQPYGAAKPAPPREVLIAFWLIVAAAVLNVINSFLLAAAAGQFIAAMWDDPQFQEQLRQAAGDQDPGSITPEMVSGPVAVTLVIVGLITLGLYLLVAFNVKAGRNWARILGTVFAALSLFGLAQLGLGTVVILLGVAAIVLLYMPASNAYFKDAAARRSGYYGR